MGAFEVLNGPPDAIDDSASTNEDSSVTIHVLANDSDPDNDPLSIESVDSNDTVGLVTIQGDVIEYNPIGQFDSLAAGTAASDTFSYTISDGNGETATALVTVNIIGINDEPQITALQSTHPNLDSRSSDGHISISGAFFDVDLGDQHTVLVNWGDGSDPESVAVDPEENTFTGDHHYTSGGIFEITVTVDDANGGTDTAAATAIVEGVGLVHGTLYLIGSEGKDQIELKSKTKKDELSVDAKFNNADHRCHRSGRHGGSNRFKGTFKASQIDRVVAFLGDGDDKFHGDTGAIPNIIFGGAGEDDLKGGNGHDALFGGTGNDKLKGRGGNDILVGGDGEDDLKGEKGDDLLIGGMLGDLDMTDASTLDSVDAALAAWAASDWDSALDWLGDPDDDNDRDKLDGGKGIDRLFAGVGDKAKR